MGLITWYLDAPLAMHEDCKEHAGAMMTFEKGAITSFSCKQKINTKIFTLAELVWWMMFYNRFFVLSVFLGQKYSIERNEMKQDNMHAMKL